MITIYEIDGFRSLRGFSIELKSGLNILVGPNGSGKTNFLDFLDFLENTVRQNGSTAVSSQGGIGRVFSQENTKNSAIRAKISGVAQIPHSIYRKQTYNFYFEYELEIKYSKIYSSIYISKEIIRFGKLQSRLDNITRAASSGALTLTRKSPNPDLPPVLKLAKSLQSTDKRNPFTLINRIGRALGTNYANMIDFQTLSPDESILALRSSLPVFSAIGNVLARGRSCNIVPEKVRVPDEIIKPPIIVRDGSGLSSTLYALKKLAAAGEITPRTRVRRATPGSLASIVEWTKLVFIDLKSIDVDRDPHTGKYIAHLTVGDPALKLPLQSLSDGTLKWLCIVTLIVTSGSIYSIEEPENFLHPKMQEFLIYLIRETLEEDEDYFILSTHSETLLNHCRPEELILFEFCNNRTICMRIDNVQQVYQQLEKTGFGLGHYYASNAL